MAERCSYTDAERLSSHEEELKGEDDVLRPRRGEGRKKDGRRRDKRSEMGGTVGKRWCRGREGEKEEGRGRVEGEMGRRKGEERKKTSRCSSSSFLPFDGS